LLSNYGKVDYLWFDGCGSEGHEYDKPRIIKAIRGLQPEILIFNMWDPDTRWVGNEGGAAGVLNGNVRKELDFSVVATERESMAESRFLPAECDFMLRFRNWFYSEYDVHTVKSLDELVGLYYYSVGCGANFLINISPDRRGLLPGVDAARLLEFGAEIKRRFADPLTTEVRESKNGITVSLEREQLVNHLVISEDMTEGESVEEFNVYITSGIIFNPICVYTGKKIGRKRILSFPAILAKELTVEVTHSIGAYKINATGAYYIR